MVGCSFIIPVYNCKQYLEECVASVIKAILLLPFVCEIILIDDGSIDGSADLCEQLMENNPTIIKAYHQKNSGVSVARNYGIAQAQGEYIAFLDADDSIVPEKMAALLRKVQSNKVIDMAVFGLNYYFIQNGKINTVTQLSPAMTGQYSKNEWAEQLLSLYRSNALTSSCSRIIKKSIIDDNVIYFNENLISFEDLDFTLRTMAFCDQILFVPDLIYNYEVRVGDGKYQKRMDRIMHISDVTNPLEQSLHCIKDDEETDSILISVYALLLKDKQVGKSKKIILDMFDEFAIWVDQHQYKDRVFAVRDLKAAYKKRYHLIRLRQGYYALRHRIALKIKGKIHYVGNQL